MERVALFDIPYCIYRNKQSVVAPFRVAIQFICFVYLYYSSWKPLSKLNGFPDSPCIGILENL